MRSFSAFASATPFLLVACFQETAAFAPHLGTRAPAGPQTRSSHLHGNRLHRIHRSSESSNRVNNLPVRGATGGESHEHDLQGLGPDRGDGGASTRLDFGVGLGAAAAALFVGSGPRHVLAEETAADGSDGGTAPVVAEETSSPPPEAATPAAAPSSPALRDLALEVPYTGKSVPLNKFLGSRATLVVNPKIDDPESLHQMPGITKLASEYSSQGLNVLLFPTEQGTFEADEDRVVRIKFYQFYGFGQFPKAVVFDKVDIVGTTIHPFYRYLCRSLKNPNGIARVTLNYEKFLLDKDGKVVRRYPRKLEAADFEKDVQAVLAGQPLPAENRDYKLSWLKADQEALKSEYAFKLGLNYYNN